MATKAQKAKAAAHATKVATTKATSKPAPASGSTPASRAKDPTENLRNLGMSPAQIANALAGGSTKAAPAGTGTLQSSNINSGYRVDPYGNVTTAAGAYVSQAEFQRLGLNVTQIPSTQTPYAGTGANTNTGQGVAAYQAGQNKPVMTPETLAGQSMLPIVPTSQTPAFPVSTLQPLQATAEEQKATNLSTQIGGLYDQMVGKSVYQGKQEEKFGVNEAQRNLADLSSQLTTLKNEADAIPLQLQQGAAERGVTTSTLGAQQNSRLRTNAIAALGISSLLAASQGQLANAQAMADRAVSQKYDPILEQIAAKKANLELILNDPSTELADKNRALAQKDSQDAKEATIAQQKADSAAVWDIATNSATNGSAFKPVGQYTSLATTLQAISNAPSKEVALQIASSTGLLSGAGADGTGSMQEYSLAQSQGFTGTYQQWVDRASQYKTGSGGGGGTKTSTAGGAGAGYDTAAKNLTAQRIPVTSLNQNGTMATAYRKELLDSGIDGAVVDWLWKNVTAGASFDEIRTGLRANGADTNILDTFVQTLQD